jgi:hypothetical protein
MWRAVLEAEAAGIEFEPLHPAQPVRKTNATIAPMRNDSAIAVPPSNEKLRDGGSRCYDYTLAR